MSETRKYYAMDGVEIPEEEIRRLNPHMFDTSLPIPAPRIGDLVSVCSERPESRYPWGVVVGLSERSEAAALDPQFWGPRNPPIDAIIGLTRPMHRDAYLNDPVKTWEKKLLIKFLAVIIRADG
jgi:hypothetical protein